MTPDMRASQYRLVVRGELSGRFASVCGGMRMYPAAGQTVIVGVVADQAMLHEVLHRLSGLGIELISLAEIDAAPVTDAGMGAGPPDGIGSR